MGCGSARDGRGSVGGRGGGGPEEFGHARHGLPHGPDKYELDDHVHQDEDAEMVHRARKPALHGQVVVEPRQPQAQHRPQPRHQQPQLDWNRGAEVEHGSRGCEEGAQKDIRRVVAAAVDDVDNGRRREDANHVDAAKVCERHVWREDPTCSALPQRYEREDLEQGVTKADFRGKKVASVVVEHGEEQERPDNPEGPQRGDAVTH
eukprot:3937001-Rhodomonas_salina.2